MSLPLKTLIPTLVGIFLLLALAGCGRAGQFLEFPGTGDYPGPDWVEQTDLTRISAEPPGLEGVTISAVEAGTRGAQRIIFVHGTPGASSDFYRFLLSAPDDYHFISIDRPGFGRTEPAKVRPRLADQAAALEPFLGGPDEPKAILVGWSLGGPVIVRAAIEYPERVGGIVMLAGNLDPELEEWKLYNEVASWWIVRPFLKRYWDASNRELAKHKKELKRMALLLDQVRTPVAFVHARDDDLVPIENTDYAKKKFVHAEIVGEYYADRGGHYYPIGAAEVTARAIGAVVDAANSRDRK